MGKKIRRIQRRRTKGFKTPPKTKFCGRRSKYQNPFKVIQSLKHEFIIENTITRAQGTFIHKTKQAATKVACQMFAYFLHQKYPTDESLKEFLSPLKEYENLSCWCKPDEQCHVDYLIYLIEKFKINEI